MKPFVKNPRVVEDEEGNDIAQLPPRIEDQGKRQMDISSVPASRRPLLASEDDLFVGMDDSGRSLYKTRSGSTYAVETDPDQRTERERLVDTAGAVVDYIRDPSLPDMETVKAFGKAALEGGADFIERVGRGGMTAGDLAAIGTVGMTAPVQAPEGALRIFGGLRSKRLDSQQRKGFIKAEEEYAKGEKPRDLVWRETGWGKFDDDVWRYEIDDSPSSISPVFNAKRLELKSLPKDQQKYELTMGALLDHPILYEAYPELANTRVVVRHLDDNTQGEFYPSSGDIHLNIKLGKDEARSVLLHELQHSVQRIEALDAGANPVTFAREYEKFPELKEINDIARDYRMRRDSATTEDMRAYYDRVYQDELKHFDEVAFNLYQGKTGEREARNVEYRKDIPESARKTLDPYTTERQLLQHERVPASLMNRAFESKYKRRTTDIELPIESYTDIDGSIRKALSRDEEGAVLASLKKGDTVAGSAEFLNFKGVPDFTFERFDTVSTQDVADYYELPEDYPMLTMKDKDGYDVVPVAVLRTKGRLQKWVPVHTLLFKEGVHKNARPNRPTGKLRFGGDTYTMERDSAPMIDVADDFMELPGEFPEASVSRSGKGLMKRRKDK